MILAPIVKNIVPIGDFFNATIKELRGTNINLIKKTTDLTGSNSRNALPNFELTSNICFLAAAKADSVDIIAIPNSMKANDTIEHFIKKSTILSGVLLMSLLRIYFCRISLVF